MADIGAQVDIILQKYEEMLPKLEAAKGSVVKLQNAELETLALLQDVESTLVKALDPSDENREALLSVFGGDCSRISRLLQFISATTLSDEHASDTRFTQCQISLRAIENIIREKGQGEALEAAQAKAAQEKAAQEKAPQEKAAESDGAGAAVAAIAQPEKAEEDIKKEEGEPKRDIMIELGVEVAPQVDWGEGGGEFTLEVPSLKAKVKTIVTPPLPELDLKAYPEEQLIEIDFPEIKKVIFDPTTKTPTDGLFKATATAKVELIEIPDTIGFKVGAQPLQTWGAHKVREGDERTELHYVVQIGPNFSHAAGKGSWILSADLNVTFDCQLAGAGSAKFTTSGAVRLPPQHN